MRNWLFTKKLPRAMGNAVPSLVQPAAMFINAVRLARNHAKEPTEVADQLVPDFFPNL